MGHCIGVRSQPRYLDVGHTDQEGLVEHERGSAASGESVGEFYPYYEPVSGHVGAVQLRPLPVEQFCTIFGETLTLLIPSGPTAT